MLGVSVYDTFLHRSVTLRSVKSRDGKILAGNCCCFTWLLFLFSVCHLLGPLWYWTTQHQTPRCTVCHHYALMSQLHGQRQGMMSRNQHQTDQSDHLLGLMTGPPKKKKTFLAVNNRILYLKWVTATLRQQDFYHMGDFFQVHSG